MISWSIFRKTEDVEVYIGVLSAESERDAVAKTVLMLMLPDIDRRQLIAPPWDEKEKATGKAGPP
jgi:hypothetical protein